MRAVLDTNVSIKAVITPAGPSGRVLEAFTQGRFELITLDLILTELGEKLKSPRLRQVGFTPEATAALPMLHGRGTHVTITGTPQVGRDPRDDKFIETAIRGSADVIVTEDKDLLEDPAVREALGQHGDQAAKPLSFLHLLDQLP